MGRLAQKYIGCSEKIDKNDMLYDVQRAQGVKDVRDTVQIDKRKGVIQCAPEI